MVNFRIVEGDDLYESVKEEFVRLYNNGVKIQDIQKRLGLSDSQYMKYFKRLRKSGEITKLRNQNAGRKENHHDHYKKYPKHYSFNRRGCCWDVKFRGTYYTCFKRECEAQRFVELMRECDWDKSRKDELRQRVLREDYKNG